MSLLAFMIDRIKSNGPLTIADYMHLALQHETYGYYIRRDPLGVSGDFITAPEISQIFGELIGAWIATQWGASGYVGGALVELGPGRGTLMADILRGTKHAEGFHDSISVHLVETSPTLREKQQQLLADAHPSIHWHNHLEDVPHKPLFLIANEFFDALPIRQFKRTEEGWKERVVSINDKDKLIFGYITAKPPASLKHLPVSDNLYEYSEASHDMINHIGQRLTKHQGAALIIDYGYMNGTNGNTLQAVRNHQFHDVLNEPGSADLTSHVDFSALATTAKKTKATPHPLTTQASLLLHLGGQIRLRELCKHAMGEEQMAIISSFNRLTSPDEMGDLFKALCITNPNHPKPTGFEKQV